MSLYFSLEVGTRKWEMRNGKWESGNGKQEMGIWKWEVGNSQNFSLFSKKLNCAPRNEKWDSNKNSHFQSFPLWYVIFDWSIDQSNFLTGQLTG